MSRLFVLLLILILVATFGASAAHAQGLPPVFQLFYGTVEINGQPAPVGTTVEARGTGVLTPNDNPNVKDNPLTLTFAGQYGVDPGRDPLDPKLMVQGSIADGTPIEFYVNGEKAECAIPDGAWQSSFPFTSGGVITRLNLRVGAASQPTATATPTTGAATVATATPTIRSGSGVTDPTPTPGPGPTATRLTAGPTNTPVQGAAPTQAAAPAVTARPGSTATALPGAVVATPTGQAPQAAGTTAPVAPVTAPAAAGATAVPAEAQAPAVATPLPTRTPAAIAQAATSEPILKADTPAPQSPAAAPANTNAGTGRSIALWGGLGALLIAVAVGVFIKVRR